MALPSDIGSRILDAAQAQDQPVSVSVSAETGQVRTVEERVARIRTESGSGTRGSCQPGYSSWGD